LDGCFGSEDAALRQPYANRPQNRGILFHSDEEATQFAKRANREGLQIEMHAIGDAAWTTFDEKERGSLETGKMADMVILNRNPLTMKPNELLGLKVENLLLKGEPYRKGQGMLSLLAKRLLMGGKV